VEKDILFIPITLLLFIGCSQQQPTVNRDGVKISGKIT